MIDIAGRLIGPGHPCYIVAEAGVNHNGDIRTALRLIDAAKAAGADACKFQHWSTSRLLSPDHPMYRTLLPLELSEGQLRHLKAHADEVGITFLCTPDQAEDADFLDVLGVPAFKIGSGNLRNLPFLRHVAGKGKPVLLSTGMATLLEVQAAVDAIQMDGGNNQIVLLHCVSVYSIPIGQEFDCSLVNLRAMDAMRDRLGGLPVGYSDHSRSFAVACAAVARGACVYEAHVRLGAPDGLDGNVSLSADEFGWIVSGIRKVEAALGDGVKRPVEAEAATREYVDSWRR